MKKFFIQTFGCQMNVYDSARMVDLLQQDDDYIVIDEPNDADVIIFNTCSIREKANEIIFSFLEITSLIHCSASSNDIGLCVKEAFANILFSVVHGSISYSKIRLYNFSSNDKSLSFKLSILSCD